MDELPDVGGGKQAVRLSDSSLQPIAYHALPRMVMDSLHHALWGMSTIDMTPGFGELCCDMVLNNIGYVGICHSDFQKQFIKDKLIREMFLNMRNSTSKVYAPAYASECTAQDTAGSTPQNVKGQPQASKGGKVENKADNPGSTPTPAGSSPSGALSAALQKMLEAAKTANPSSS